MTNVESDDDVQSYGWQLTADGRMVPGPVTVTISANPEKLREHLLARGFPLEAVALILARHIVQVVTEPIGLGNLVTQEIIDHTAKTKSSPPE